MLAPQQLNITAPPGTAGGQTIRVTMPAGGMAAVPPGSAAAAQLHQTQRLMSMASMDARESRWKEETAMEGGVVGSGCSALRWASRGDCTVRRTSPLTSSHQTTRRRFIFRVTDQYPPCIIKLCS